jgi:hypothetical protein
LTAAQVFSPYFWKNGVGSTLGSASLTQDSMSAMYCWCRITSSRVPSLPRWPPIGKGLLGHRPGWVVVSHQKATRLLASNSNDVLAEQRGRSGVVGVVVGVDEMSHFVAHAVCFGDLVHCALDVVTDRWRRVEEHHAVLRDQER